MIYILAPEWKEESVEAYALQEMERLVRRLTFEEVNVERHEAARQECSGDTIELKVDTDLGQQRVVLECNSENRSALIQGGDPAALLHGVYTFCEQLGCVFESSGEVLPERVASLSMPSCNMDHVPSMPERGIRMHLNFVQDQSFFTEDAFAAFIDDMARQRYNYLLFHMYTPQQWFPFTYGGVKHLDLKLGNLSDRELPDDMIGRHAVKTEKSWYPADLEGITDPEELLDAMYGRFKRMMSRAHARGIRNCVSFEPASLPQSMKKKLPEWTGETTEAMLGNQDLSQEWQEGWSGMKLISPEIRHPLMRDIAVERTTQCIDAFPDLDEVQLISGEGVKWRPGENESYEGELQRLAERFDLPEVVLDQAAMAEEVPPDEGPEMNPKAHPYWTVLPGEDFFPTVVGALRFVEFAYDIVHDQRVKEKLKEGDAEISIAVYSPHPETIRLMMPGIAEMLPPGVRFHCLADYGAKDIAENLPAWEPLKENGQRIGVMSWLEFDGTFLLAQGWGDALGDNVKRAIDLGAETMHFNHWRVRSLEHNSAIAAAMCWDANRSVEDAKTDYFRRLFGPDAVSLAFDAYQVLDEVTHFSKNNNYNIGFSVDWVFKNSTGSPGYYWPRLIKSIRLYDKAAALFSELANAASNPGGKQQARYMADVCIMSKLHIQGVYHLQNAKLPLMGYNAWPLGNEHACWPPPEKLQDIVAEARNAYECARTYAQTYAKWVESCDEQGQLVMHEKGIIESFGDFAQQLHDRLKAELENGENVERTGQTP